LFVHAIPAVVAGHHRRITPKPRVARGHHRRRDRRGI